MAFELPVWLNQSNTDLIPNAIAKGTAAGESIASGMRARRQQGLNEQQRAVENDLRRREAEQLMTMRGLHEQEQRNKMATSAAETAARTRGLNKVKDSISDWDWDNQLPKGATIDDVREHQRQRIEFIHGAFLENSGDVFGSRDLPASVLNQPRDLIGPAQERTKQAEIRAGGTVDAAKVRAGSSEFTWDMRNASAEAIAAEKRKTEEKIAAGKTTTAQKDVQALREAEDAALMASGKPPRNPAEATARTVELLTPKVTGQGRKAVTADITNFDFSKNLESKLASAATPAAKAIAESDLKSFRRMSNMEDTAKTPTERIKVAVATAKIKALTAEEVLLKKPGLYKAEIDAIYREFGGDTTATAPEAKPKYFFKRGALGVEQAK